MPLPEPDGAIGDTVEECAKLAELRKVLGTELEDWGTRHLRSKKGM